MELPCKRCIVYAACSQRMLWDLLDECSLLLKHIRKIDKDSTEEDYKSNVMYQRWSQTLLTIQKKGYL